MMSRRKLVAAFVVLLALGACGSGAPTVPKNAIEPAIRNIGPNRILVEIPVVRDPTAAKRILKRVAALRFALRTSGHVTSVKSL